MKTKTFANVSFKIDRPKGTVKEWPQKDGSVKRFIYPVDYGYLPRHTGEDDEGLDFFVGDDPNGHLESFQKLHRDSVDTRVKLDETKFLVGVNDRDRETIYRLYGPEVWHRRIYHDMDDLMRSAAKFKGAKKTRYAVSTKQEKTASDDLYYAMEKDALSFRESWQALKTLPGRISNTLKGHVPTMMPLENVRPHRTPSNFAMAETRPWKRPSWESPNFKPAPTFSEAPQVPHDYHPGMGGISEWFQEEHHPSEVMTMYPHNAPTRTQMDMLPRNSGMRQAVLQQKGLDPMNRSIMSELGRQYETLAGRGDPGLQAFVNRVGQGEAPGYQAAHRAFQQHYQKQAALALKEVLAKYKLADIDKRLSGEVMVTSSDKINDLFDKTITKMGAETTPMSTRFRKLLERRPDLKSDRRFAPFLGAEV